MKKRSRACEACHRLKIKCDVSGGLEGACERCTRNNLECTPAAPRLQRDRINELEAQVQELKNVLRDGSSSVTPGESPESLLEDSHNAILFFLDARISVNKQSDLLRIAAHQLGAMWPVICLDTDLDDIRAKSPVLLLAVLTYCVTQEQQGTDLSVHDELVRETVRILADEVITRGQRSLELVQALLTTAFWNKTTRKGYQGSCYQLAQLASDMAIDLGIAGQSFLPSPPAYFSHHEDSTSLDARRTWLACFVLSSASSLQVRRPHATPWDAHHEDCLAQLETHGLPSDILFCQIVRITQLIQEIADNLGLCRLGVFVDGNSYDAHSAMELLKDKVNTWAAQVPPSLASSQTLKLWHHAAMVYIHELALHTPTNKLWFAAPFVPERIPVNDFPKPISIIPPLGAALHAAVYHCHAVVDIAGEMDPTLALGLPTFCFAPTVLYSLFVLVTMFVAATDPANTYGENLPRDSFLIENCGMRLQSLNDRMKPLDPTMSSYTSRMIDATGWLKKWYNDYNVILERYRANLTG